MGHDFIVKALSSGDFSKFFSMSAEELEKSGARIMEADSNPGYPCRVSLRDAEIGEKVLAISFAHHDVNTPYKSSGPIFVRLGADTAKLGINEIPTMLLHRSLSIRAYNNQGMMIEADVIDGTAISERLEGYFGNDRITYVHIHNAKPGCFNCEFVRSEK